MRRWRLTTIATWVAVVVVSACSQMSDGAPVADPSTSSSPSTGATTSARATIPTRTVDAPPFGVVPTVRAPIPASSVTCSPPARQGILIVAKVADPHAPAVTVPVPGGWNLARGSGDVATRMDGPDGLTATVTIASTKLDAAAAFREYADQLTAKYSVSAVSILPDELCDYSGQKLTGTLSNTTEDAIQFVDRIVHVWTNTGDYLVAIHVGAPAGVADLDTISEALIGDFEIRIP